MEVSDSRYAEQNENVVSPNTAINVPHGIALASAAPDGLADRNVTVYKCQIYAAE